MAEIRENPAPGISELEKIFNQYKSKLELAEKDSSEIIGRAQQKADSILATAQERAKQTIDDAERRAKQVAEEADRKASLEADRLVSEAKARADQIVKDADGSVRKDAREKCKREVDKILNETREASDKRLSDMLAQAKREADQIIREVKDTARAEAQTESVRITSEANAQAKQIEDAALARLTEADQTLVTISQKAESIVEQARSRMQADFAELLMKVAKVKGSMAHQNTPEPGRSGNGKKGEDQLLQSRRELRILRPYDERRVKRLVDFLKQVPNVKLAGEAGTASGLTIYVDVLQPTPLLTILRDMSLIDSSDVRGDVINLTLAEAPAGK